jgi:hypothetical protein
MATEREKLIKIISEKYPKIVLRTTEEFDGTEGGIWTSGENGFPAKDGFPLFEYYASHGKRYDMGVHKDINKILDKHGWYAEWNDPGTIMFWEA